MIGFQGDRYHLTVQRSQPGTYRFPEGLYLSVGQLVAGLHVVGREQEDVLDPSLLLSPHQPLSAVLGLSEQPEGLANPLGEAVRDRRWVCALRHLYSSLPEPTHVRATRVLEPWLAFAEPSLCPPPGLAPLCEGYGHDKYLP